MPNVNEKLSSRVHHFKDCQILIGVGRTERLQRVVLRLRKEVYEQPVYFGDDFSTFLVKLRKADLMFRCNQLERGFKSLNLGIGLCL